MMRGLFNNTMLAGAAFLVTGLVGLAVVPLIVGKWGLAAFGAVVLARAFIPQGFLALFDFGASELATQAVARARVNGAWGEARAKLDYLLVRLIAVGLGVAAILWFSAAFWTDVLNIAPEDATEFTTIVRLSGLACAFLLPALVAEGVVKGYEQFALVRSLEVGGSVIFFVVVAAALPFELPYSVPAYAYLGALVCRFLVLAVAAARRWPRPRAADTSASAFDSGALFRHMGIMAQGRAIGVVQSQLVVPLAAGLFGASAAGLLDILTRLPRFLKQALAVLNTSLLPVSTRIDERGDRKLMDRLTRVAFVILPAVTVPPLIGAAVFANPVLIAWVGPDYGQYWMWMALMFAVPVAAQYIAFGGVVMLARPNVQARLNLLTMAQIAGLLAIALALVPFFAERGFIVGQAVSTLLVLPFQLYVVGRQMNSSLRRLASVIALQAAVTVPLAAGAFWFQSVFPGPAIAEIAIGVVPWCIAFWAIEYAVLLTPVDRAEVHSMIRAPLQLLRRRPSGTQ